MISLSKQRGEIDERNSVVRLQDVDWRVVRGGGGIRKDYEGIEMIWSGYVMATDRGDARKKGKAEAAKAARKAKRENLAQ